MALRHAVTAILVEKLCGFQRDLSMLLLDGTNSLCGLSACTAEGSRNFCCLLDLAEYTSGSFYIIPFKMSRASAEEQKCTSSQAIDVFGVTIGDGQHLVIGHDEVKARSASFTELHEAFKKVAPADAEAWLLQNGAVVVSDGGPITQTIKVVSNLLSYFTNR
jgi:hypothetical protein